MMATSATATTNARVPAGATSDTAADGPIRRQLEDLLDGHRRSQLVYVAAKLGLADLLADGPRTSPDLAAACDCDPDALHRVLRAMVAIGLLDAADGRFGLTRLGRCLQTDAPEALRGSAILCGETQYAAYGALLHSVRTGRSAFDHVFGIGVREHRTRHAELGAYFDRQMAARTAAVAGALAAAYDFAPFRTIVDVGGGTGALLVAVLRANPHLHGVLFDAPPTIDAARPLLRDARVGHRCEAVPGDFFVSVPDGGDLYLLKGVVHGWDDARAAAILRNCRRVVPPHGRLLVIEQVLPEAVADAPAVVQMDLQMLVMTGGRQRTAAELRTLLAEARLRVTRLIPTCTAVSLLEAAPI